jgi:hypothetical protein
MANLLEDPEIFRALAAGRTFTFNEESEYAALANGSHQVGVLEEYSKQSGIPVYYLFYNPLVLPWAATVPATALPALPDLEVGARVMPAKVVHRLLSPTASNHHPNYADLLAAPAPFRRRHAGGWRLEHFVADELVACREGYVAGANTDHALEQLFYSRSGPISAAVAVTIEAPEGVEFELPLLEG